jgi:hypothetical protein
VIGISGGSVSLQMRTEVTSMKASRHIAVGMLLALAVAAAIGLAQLQTVRAQSRTSAGTSAEATKQIVSAAQALLATLDGAGRAKVQFPFDGPQKARWSNLPSGIFQREGLRIADLTSTQRDAVRTLLTTALSRQGNEKVEAIMQGDEVLRQGEPANGPGGGRRGGRPGGPGGGVNFGKDQYFLAFLGTPSTTQPWMLQFGGHHLAINLTMGGSQASMTPSLPAAQPATYSIEGRTVRPLGAENDKAFALINALDNAQRSQAILPYRVADLVLGPGQDGRTIQPEGIRASALTASQQAMLLELAREWAGIMHDAFATARMAEIKANLPNTYFAWSGPTTNGSAAYFRVQGPTVVIEYAPQGGVDHIHTIYRDPTNDYGARFASK